METPTEPVILIGRYLVERGWMIATAESCTGGLLGHTLTSVSGSSEYYQGGVISYSNRIKHELLGVPEEVLTTVGAVSKETALAMARRAQQMCAAQVALATTGIAGPLGGTPTKPVGTVYIAYVDGCTSEVLHLCWNGDRAANNRATVQAALELALKHLSRAEGTIPG